MELRGNRVGVPFSLRMVVTTRPCKAASEVSQSISYRGVEVVGFTNEDVASFVHKYLGKERGTALLAQLEKRPAVASMMHAPLFCLLICDLFQHDQDLPSRGTEIFQKIAVSLLRCYAKAHGSNASFRDMSKAPPRLRELILGLGKVAYDGLQKKQMYFTEGELEEAGLPSEALQLGLLTKSESTDIFQEDKFAFPHLTLQEFLSAFFVSCEVLKTSADVAKLLEKVRLLDGHLSTFWVFLAGLLRVDMMEDLLQRLSKLVETPNILRGNRFRPMLMLFRCFTESCLARSGSRSASIGKILENHGVYFVVESFSVFDCTAISIALQSHAESKDLHTVDLRGCSMADAGLEQLLPGLHCCKSIQELIMSLNAVTGQHMSKVGVILTNNASTLFSLNLSVNSLGDDGLEKLVPGIKQCKKLKSLGLGHTGLTSRSGSILGNVVSGPVFCAWRSCSSVAMTWEMMRWSSWLVPCNSAPA